MKWMVTKTWEDPNKSYTDPPPWNLHETFEVSSLADVPGVFWDIHKYGASGHNGRRGLSGLVTYIARPVEG